MNRYFFSQRNDDNFNKIGLTYAPNRHTAAQLFAIRKGLKLKEFLNIYSVYNFTKIILGKKVIIKHRSNTVIFSYNDIDKTYVSMTCFGPMKQKYNINKFIQFLNYLEKEECYRILQD